MRKLFIFPHITVGKVRCGPLGVCGRSGTTGSLLIVLSSLIVLLTVLSVLLIVERVISAQPNSVLRN